MATTSDLQDPSSSAHRGRGSWWVILALSLGGLLVSVLLTRIHYKVHTDASFHSFCARSATFDCDAVAHSAYSVWFGVPLSVWGVFGYLVSTATVIWGLRSRRSALAVGAILWLATAYLGVSLTLGLISALRVRSFCVLCMGTYAINLLVLLAALLLTTRVGFGNAVIAPLRILRQRTGASLGILLLLGAVGGGLIPAYPAYWKHSVARGRAERGIDPDGSHWIGARTPRLTITEFSDYECPYCRQAHQQLRAVVERFPNTLRVIHRHFPLDQACNRDIDRPFHQTACRAAVIAECASRAGRFWEANDYLFEHARMLENRSIQDIAQDLKLDPSSLETCMAGDGLEAVKRDVEIGITLKLDGTPSFVVDGKVYSGNLPAGTMDRLGD